MSTSDLTTATEEFIASMKGPTYPDRLYSALILDTNVAADIYSIGNLLSTIESEGVDLNEGMLAVPSSQKFRYRQHRLRHSLILAWWLSRTKTPASTLGAEHLQLVTSELSPIAAPRSQYDAVSFETTVAYIHIVQELVLDWRPGALIDVDHYKQKAEADNEILRIAQLDRTTVITWEGLKEDLTLSSKRRSLRNRCTSHGVTVATPTEWLKHNDVDVDVEAQHFLRACDTASWDVQREGTRQGRGYVDLLIGFYRLALLGECIKPLRYYFGRRP